MNRIIRLKNTVQEYDWGSRTAIPQLLGEKCPSEKPRAELWMGAHPKAPSYAYVEHQWVPLDKLVNTFPSEILGKGAAEKFDNTLPFLFKVLAADKPLSIQAHPHRRAAERGFLKETNLQIPLDAFNRNYKDKNHKPECLCALTSFWALNGFRPVSQIVAFWEILFAGAFYDIRHHLEMQQGRGRLQNFFHALMTMATERKNKCVEAALGVIKKTKDLSPEFHWMRHLYKEYPGDIGVLSPIFLNLVCLEPGEAMYLGAGELHAYLQGTGIELMANSDNVLRGGLTTKHVDVDELLKVLNFEEREVDILLPDRIDATYSIYNTPAAEFFLSRIAVAEGREHTGVEKRSVEILLCVDGTAVMTSAKEHVNVMKGTSVIVPAASPEYRISGTATFYKAAVPLSF